LRLGSARHLLYDSEAMCDMGLRSFFALSFTTRMADPSCTLVLFRLYIWWRKFHLGQTFVSHHQQPTTANHSENHSIAHPDDNHPIPLLNFTSFSIRASPREHRAIKPQSPNQTQEKFFLTFPANTRFPFLVSRLSISQFLSQLLFITTLHLPLPLHLSVMGRGGYN
jgi:hypothetical protein